ncbi:NAD-dependent epimerase/dehydratase family protein [Sulfurovum sp. NBC37-1]|uniref:NAD-dependent epimerase/dehydratase family protein n=1 Tax=Sulfurovum sp. (strain NBC37-1) TaxID=387093 RepID=UPI0001587BD6|nr:NAD-dependent epimerase/dehydratase family protein [Sulfurovum sp. NBC37-1]BAF73083.1 sugar epimerase/dehydratase [Sulfurovum sp. NBC37-1]
MNILITGANGFIASHLKEYLRHNYIYNIFAPNSKELNLIDEEAVDKFIIGNKIDIIIHTANKGGGRDSIDFKNLTEYNLRMFFNIAKHEKNVKKIISFGSGAEYGKHKPIINVSENEYWDTQPLDEYGLYKSIISKYIEKSNKIVQLRIFGCYGEYENYRYKFISNAIVKNLLHLPIVIHQNVLFDYMYVDDMMRIIDWFIHNDNKEKIYNVSTGTKVDLISLANIVNKISDFKSEVTILNAGHNNEYTSSNKRLLDELINFKFSSHTEAIEKIRNYFRYNADNIDKESIFNDPFLQKINTMWKK